MRCKFKVARAKCSKGLQRAVRHHTKPVGLRLAFMIGTITGTTVVLCISVEKVFQRRAGVSPLLKHMALYSHFVFSQYPRSHNIQINTYECTGQRPISTACLGTTYAPADGVLHGHPPSYKVHCT